jgi:precorrin-3B C17-methyltransferase
MAARTLARAADLADDERPVIEVVPGVTAALAAGALLGAPLGDDFAALSLSDLHVSWEVVERRLTAVAAAGLALALYNPRSRTRTWQLERVLEVLREHRADDTPLAVVTDAARAGQRVARATLATLDPETVTMRSLLVVAGDSGRLAGPWLVAERGAEVPA